MSLCLVARVQGPRAWGATTLAADDGTPDTDTSGDGTIGTVTTSACKFTAAAAGGDAWDDANRCDIAPMHIKVCERLHIFCGRHVVTGIYLYAACSCHALTEWKRAGQAPGSAGSATYADVRTPTVRCQALLDTNWAHDLRGSCDATAKWCVLLGGRFDRDLPVYRLFLSKHIETQRPRGQLAARLGLLRR
eukprot:COSAG01_NODE_15680_length_1311_cov_1.201320_1_plen_191_part_00